MNSKVLIILIILVLIVLMLCLITKKPIKENFFAADDACATGDDETECGGLNGCKWDADASACNEDCLFDPVSRETDKTVNLDICTGADEETCGANSHNTYCFWDAEADEGNGKCLYKRTGEDIGKFADESDVSKLFDSCVTECQDTWNDSETTVTDRGVDGEYSRCKDNECIDKCNAYALERAKDGLKTAKSYADYPTDHVAGGDYTNIKDHIITQLGIDGSDLQTKFKDKLYDDVVCETKDNTECVANNLCEWDGTAATPSCKSADIGKLNKIMKTLANLNNSGNDFVQQIGQLGEFQEKYSDKIEEILEGRAEKDPTDQYIRALQSKLDEVDDIFANLDNETFGKTDLDDLLESPHRSITCIANNITLNLTPVQYTNNEDTGYYPKRYGAYMINLDGTGGVVNEHLYYYSYSSADTGRAVCDIDADTECDKWTLNKTSDYTDAGGTSNGAHVILKDEGNGWDTLQKRDGFFWIIQINSEKDYNSILIKHNIDSILASTDTPIKYPFYVVESARRPGYLLNVKAVGTNRSLTVERANNNGTEKFTASPAPTAKCISY
jgi:hypothetical protein